MKDTSENNIFSFLNESKSPFMKIRSIKIRNKINTHEVKQSLLTEEENELLSANDSLKLFKVTFKNSVTTFNSSSKSSDIFKPIINDGKDINESVVKNHKCSLCTKAFLSEFDLIKHTRIHTKERPFICKVCNKSYSQSYKRACRHVSAC